MNKTVVLIPTYNEAESIVSLLDDLRKISVDVLVIDDDSPDGTALIVENLKTENFTVLHHGAKRGIGAAYLDGFQQSLKYGYEKIATMDADGSHLVSDLEKMLRRSETCDVVMGTRWMKNGLVSNWPLHRRLLSKFGTWYARKALLMPFKDLTGGLRIYNSDVLTKLNLEAIGSNGYCFQIEMIRALSSFDVIIEEVPIHFIERTTGKSKMSRTIVLEAFLRVSGWGIQRWVGHNADKLHYVK